MTYRWTDDEGHEWPITGHWCTACGLPLIPTDDSTIHPGCEVGNAEADPTPVAGTATDPTTERPTP